MLFFLQKLDKNAFVKRNTIENRLEFHCKNLHFFSDLQLNFNI